MKITVTWSQTYNTTKYYLERSLNGINGWSNIIITTHPFVTYVDTAVVSGQWYYYRVRGWNANGFSSYSNVKRAGLDTSVHKYTKGIKPVGTLAKTVLASTMTGFVFRTDNYDAATPTWRENISGLPTLTDFQFGDTRPKLFVPALIDDPFSNNVYMVHIYSSVFSAPNPAPDPSLNALWKYNSATETWSLVITASEITRSAGIMPTWISQNYAGDYDANIIYAWCSVKQQNMIGAVLIHNSNGWANAGEAVDWRLSYCQSVDGGLTWTAPFIIYEHVSSYYSQSLINATSVAGIRGGQMASVAGDVVYIPFSFTGIYPDLFDYVFYTLDGGAGWSFLAMVGSSSSFLKFPAMAVRQDNQEEFLSSEHYKNTPARDDLEVIYSKFYNGTSILQRGSSTPHQTGTWVPLTGRYFIPAANYIYDATGGATGIIATENMVIDSLGNLENLRLSVSYAPEVWSVLPADGLATGSAANYSAAVYLFSERFLPLTFTVGVGYTPIITGTAYHAVQAWCTGTWMAKAGVAAEIISNVRIGNPSNTASIAGHFWGATSSIYFTTKYSSFGYFRGGICSIVQKYPT